MTDPRRLLELDGESGVDALERELLTSLGPGDDARSKVWQALAQETGAIAGASAGAASLVATKSAATSSALGKAALPWLGTLTGKLLVVGAVAAPVAVAAVFWGSPKEKAPSAPSASAALADDGSTAARAGHGAQPAQDEVPAAPQAKDPALVAPERADAGNAPEPARGGADAVARRAKETAASALAEENRLLLEARSALRSGGGAAALRSLSVLDRRYPRGALLQERELLRIQALRASGSVTEARKLSARFLERYPESPYRATVRSFAESP